MRTDDTAMEELLERMETDPDEARERLKAFIQCVDNGESVPNEIMEYLCEGFRLYLMLDALRHSKIGGLKPQDITLNRALGLVRKKGEKESHKERDIKIALTFIELRMSGSTTNEAIKNICPRYGLKKRMIETCFSEYKEQAAEQYREKQKRRLSPEQETRLAKILDKQYKELTPLEKAQRTFNLGR